MSALLSPLLILVRHLPRSGRTAAAIVLVFSTLALSISSVSCQVKSTVDWAEFSPGVAYTNFQVANVPWSINVARVSRAQPDLQIHSLHARNKAVGIATLSSMVDDAQGRLGAPLVGVNGDYYDMRDRAFAGDPRGLQISEGEVLSSPAPGGITFWVDNAGQLHAEGVLSNFKITWPDGKSSPFAVNENRRLNIVLFTPSIGARTRTATNGVEIVLEKNGDSPWLPLAVGKTYEAKVLEVRNNGNTPIGSNQMVISVPVGRVASLAIPAEGALVKISTATTPELNGTLTAISGGPILVRNGKWQELPQAETASAAYQEKTKFERHPRTAVGWNDKFYYFVEVDGRQPGLSVGMTLKELGNYMLELGCREVMNLDGGGSAMLWANGRIQSSPSDRREREIANSLIVVRKDKKQAELRLRESGISLTK